MWIKNDETVGGMMSFSCLFGLPKYLGTAFFVIKSFFFFFFIFQKCCCGGCSPGCEQNFVLIEKKRGKE